MQLITLLTDFGLKDHRLAILKGQLYRSIESPFQLVDITHEVQAHDLVEAAFLLESAWKFFPAGTIHIVWLYPQDVRDMIIAHVHGHWMIAPDNGFLSLLADRPDMECVRAPIPDKAQAPLFRFVAGLSEDCIGGDVSKFEQTSQIRERIALKPVFSKSEIRASFLYADRFGNVYFNLRKEMFEKVRNGRPFKVFYRGMEPLTEIANTYADVAPGEMVCLFNGAGFFQISQHLGSAEDALEIKHQDSIQILFYD